MQSSILTPYTLSSEITLKNKVVMAPMTRRFADGDGCPSTESINYYAKRSDAGLIITEGTLISKDAIGYGNIPGIYTSDHIQSWQKITNAVHRNGGHIFLQIWHCGRVSHPNYHAGKLPISASNTIMNEPLGNSGLMCGESRKATIEDINNIINDYGQAAENAIKAGFDGVEIHGANGYLIDQFLHHCTNKRSDEYGKTFDDKSRFCFNVTKECVSRIGASRVGLRLSPGGHMSEISTDINDKNVFFALFKKLEKLNICYIHIGNFDDSTVYKELNNKTMTQFVRDNYSGTVIASGGYRKHESLEFLESNPSNLVAFGRPFIANPNLIRKIKNNLPWKVYQKEMLNNLI
ncbi:alkene reductase [Piscirickettsia salmonis]|uniref:alkene reductase n=1 Tax=Piscirickettsia salmonis TaxID=1238 RepID=UPI0007C97C5C|nr:N-ethylmaleimide reductase [Piscirickettsiaceae bacterium NZ-RLO1]